MKQSLLPHPSFVRAAASLALLAAAIGAAGACTADGDLDLAGGGAADASTPDASSTVPDAGTETPVTPPSLCGNKKIDKGEECDDGNASSNDGCSATCKLETAGPADLCDGALVPLAKEDASTLWRGQIEGTTTGLYNHYAASCGGGSGADAVYRIEPPLTGRATARITADFSAILSARTTCNSAKTEIGCADDAQVGGAGTTLSFPVFQGAPVFLFVDGYGGAGGTFTLDVDVQTAVCGNGKAEPPEACDDGNTTGGDGCSASCALEDVSTPSACPGTGYRLAATAAAPGKVSFAGDTGGLSNGGGSATGCFSTGSGPNAIYAITPTVSGSLSLSLLADFGGAMLHVRRECGDNATQADCVGSDDTLVPLAADIPVVAEQTVYVFVDSKSTSAKGLYTLDATLTAAECGNGVVDSGEECDDGGKANGDGCSASCTVERDPATYTCPGAPLRLEGAAPGPRTLRVRGTTTPLPGESLPASKFKACGHDKSPDVVYRVSSDIDGWLTARVKGGFNTALSVRTSCPGGTTDLACADDAGGNGEEVLGFAIDKETDYFVVVDGELTGTSGAFELSLEVVPSVCGNSVVEGGETCDDGATDDGDGCDASCKLETEKARDLCTTAPSLVFAANPDGTFGSTVVSGTTNLVHNTGVTSTHTLSPCSSNGPDAFFAFTPPISGVMTATISSATFRTSLGARTACPSAGAQIACDATTGDGGQEITFPVTQGVKSYLIVDGQNVSGRPNYGRFTMNVKIVPTGCGDTFLNAPEACDDGNTDSGDGCSSTCTIESLAGFAACPGHALALAGTGGSPRKKTLTVDTTGLPSKTGSTCGGSGPEGVVAITSDVDGLLEVKATADHAVLVYGRTACADPAAETPKSSCSSANLRSVTASIKKNTPYWVFVDGVNGAAGVTKLQITVTP